MAVMDREGEVLTTQGRQLVNIFDHGNDAAKDEARKLVGQMINGDSKEERKEAARRLERRLI